MRDYLITIGLLLALFETLWLIMVVFGFEHQNAVKIHALVVDAYRDIALGDCERAGAKLAAASGSINGTWFHYPWTKAKRDFNLTIWHPEIDQSKEVAR